MPDDRVKHTHDEIMAFKHDDLDTVDEHLVRRFLNHHGVHDHEMVYHVHPDSHELRAAGFHKHADTIDDYYRKYHLHDTGNIRVMAGAELRDLAKEIRTKLDAGEDHLKRHVVERQVNPDGSISHAFIEAQAGQTNGRSTVQPKVKSDEVKHD